MSHRFLARSGHWDLDGGVVDCFSSNQEKKRDGETHDPLTHGWPIGHFCAQMIRIFIMVLFPSLLRFVIWIPRFSTVVYLSAPSVQQIKSLDVNKKSYRKSRPWICPSVCPCVSAAFFLKCWNSTKATMTTTTSATMKTTTRTSTTTTTTTTTTTKQRNS